MTQYAWIGESRGVRLRSFAYEDIEQYRAWLQPDQEWHLWDGPYFVKPTPAEIDEACVRLRTAIDDNSMRAQSPRRRAVIVAASEPDHMLGTVSWHWESEESNWRRMGLTVYDPNTRGKGVGTAALQIWTDYLFATTAVVRLDFSTWSGNSRMLGVGHRLGFIEEARFRDAREVRGERFDSVVMGVLRREWVAASARSQPTPLHS